MAPDRAFTCEVESEDSRLRRLRLGGNLTVFETPALEAALRDLSGQAGDRLIVDGAGIARMDTNAAWILSRALSRLEEQQVDIHLDHFDRSLLDFVGDLPIPERAAELDHRFGPRKWLAAFGKWDIEQVAERGEDLAFLGRVLTGLAKTVVRPQTIRWRPVMKHLEYTGLRAIPIVALIAFLISVVIGYLGAQQLKPFGAEIFTVDLVAVGVLREMGVLLTGIIIAGRSGSAFAAELGVMRLDEEVDALRMMGLEPMEMLVLPRVIALTLALPLLTILADAMGLAGGAVLLNMLLDLSLVEYLSRLREALSPTTFWVGLMKAPVFGLIIAFVGTLRGMQVERSAEALGRQTTVAVVQSIFCIILADALFAVAFMELDI